MRIRQEIVRVAQSQVGVREEGNNQGPEVQMYCRATWMPEEAIQKGFPWCAAFVSWTLKRARSNLGLSFRDINVYEGADAYGWEKHALAKKQINQGWTIHEEEERCFSGDLVTFDFSHIGIVVRDNDSTIETIEGNTDERGSRTGGGVMEKSRKRELVKTFIRVPDL